MELHGSTEGCIWFPGCARLAGSPALSAAGNVHLDAHLCPRCVSASYSQETLLENGLMQCRASSFKGLQQLGTKAWMKAWMHSFTLSWMAVNIYCNSQKVRRFSLQRRSACGQLKPDVSKLQDSESESLILLYILCCHWTFLQQCHDFQSGYLYRKCFAASLFCFKRTSAN